jgi:hypothetical protein
MKQSREATKERQPGNQRKGDKVTKKEHWVGCKRSNRCKRGSKEASKESKGQPSEGEEASKKEG